MVKRKKESSDEGESEEGEDKAIFNMGIDTLERASKKLMEIGHLAQRVDLTLPQIQYIKLRMTKDFFSIVSPLLPDKEQKKYQEIVIKLKPIWKAKYKSGYYQKSVFIRNELTHNEKLEEKMDRILIELQLILQKEGYFMPKGDDEGDF